MNNRLIKSIVAIISVIFIAILLGSFSLNKKADALVNFQIEIAQNQYLNKDTTLKLNNIFHSVFVNYDKLTKSNMILKNDISILEKKYNDNANLEILKTIIFQRDLAIDFIKRTNSIISNSLKYINHLHFNHEEALQQLSEELISLSYEIKSTNYLTINRYEEALHEFNSIKVKNKQLKDEKKLFLSHLNVILSNAKLMQTKVIMFNILGEKLDDLYTNMNQKILAQYSEVKQLNSYSQTILFILLIIFIYMIVKFLKTEKLHQQSEQRLLNIIDKNVITSTIDLNGTTRVISKAHCKLSGYTQKELMNKPNYMMTQSSRSKEIMEILSSGKIWSGDIKDFKKNGEEYWVSSIIEPIFDEDNNIESYMGIRHDITDRIALEKLTKNQEEIISAQTEIANEERDKAIKASKSKSEFLANMSHEIRTPLNTISGFIDLLRENETDKKKLDYLNVVSSSSQNLLSIINDILDFSKIESGQLLIDKIDFNPTKEFTLIIKSFESQFTDKKIDFITSLENLPEGLYGDLLRIQQVINNLLSNAYKFTPKDKGVYLKIGYIDNNLVVEVEDEGIGISKEYQNRIFDSFSQEDSSTTRRFGGTGLGLSISYNLVHLMGGVLKVESILEKGTKFAFTLPLQKSTYKEKNSNIKKNIIFKGHVLLAEDNKANQMFMKVILNKCNLTFDIANDGLEAVDLFQSNQYDIILMDENMPNLSGIEATKKILKYEKVRKLKHTPIIALTANALVGDRQRFLESGMDEYLSKPLNKNELYSILNEYLTVKEN